MEKIAQKRVETLDSIIERLRASIKRNGLKNSKQREEVLSVLYKSGTHLSPEEVTEQIRDKEKNTSISSVYRILSFLEKNKFIVAIEIDKNGRRYEIAAKIHHDHIICLNCGNIIEFVDSDIERLQLEISDKFGAKLISHDMKLFVICSQCRAKGIN